MTDFKNYNNEASVKNVLYDTHGLSLEKLNIDDRGRARLIALLLKTTMIEKDSLEERILYYQIMNDELFEELYKRYHDKIPVFFLDNISNRYVILERNDGLKGE